jgi:adenosylmethionine-8-amino-7-oxononanoate aminotransferase
VADSTHLLHPMSELSEDRVADPTIFVRGHGVYVWDATGKRYIDAVAGLFNVMLGYGRRDLSEATARAMEELSFAKLFFNQGSASAALLAERLAQITPAGLDRFLLTVGGSDAAESAIKMARYYHASRGRPEKVTIIGRRDSYHGLSYGAMSITGNDAYATGYGPKPPGFAHIGQPNGPDAAAELEACILREGAETVAAFMAEPISLPAGVLVPPDGYWAEVRRICDRHDVLLISDEVCTGFGRTGRMFGMENWNVSPDLMTMSKGITSGYLPMAAVGVSNEVYEGIAAAAPMFLHGFTAGGHPVCSALALAVIDVMEQEDVVARAAETGGYLIEQCRALSADLDVVGDVRGLGMLVGFDLLGERSSKPGRAGMLGRLMFDDLLQRGMLIRYYGDTLVLSPPLVMTKSEVDEMLAMIEQSLRAELL